MNIGSKIKMLRHTNDMTQEQLAEHLGITSRAVSQWECDRTAPDISMIPALCHIFDISSDELLGIDIEKNNDIINEYIKKANIARNAGNYEEGTIILTEAYGKFPRSYEIMYTLADALVSEYSRKGIKEYDKVYELCNRIIKDCTDINLRYKAINILALAYEYAGNAEKMRETVKLLPRVCDTYEDYMVYTWRGKNDHKERLEYMSFLIKELFSMIQCLVVHTDDDGKLVHTIEEQKELWKLSLDLLHTFFPDGDYQYCSQFGDIACSKLVTLYQRENDLVNMWYYIEKGAGFAIHCDTYGFDNPHTSLILRGYSDGGWIRENGENRSYNILNWLLNDDSVSCFRGKEKFEKLVKRLEAVASKN